MSKEDKKYVWITPEGRFTNSWDQKDFDKYVDAKDIELAKEKGWKLIEYKCLTVKDFEFYNQMRLA